MRARQYLIPLDWLKPDDTCIGLSYFGFAAIDCAWDDPTDSESKSNYADEVAGFTNIAQLCVFSPQDVLGERLTTFKKFGLKAVLSIEPVLFESRADADSPSGERISLLPDAERRWRAFVQLNKSWLTPEYMAAVYIADEPVWRGVSETDFSSAVEIVKASLPELPTMTTEAYPVLDKMLVPTTLDWLGFDRYGHADPAHDDVWLTDLETVHAARTRTDQRIVIVADTQWYPDYEGLGLAPDDMAGVALSYFELAAKNPEVVALIGYVWPGGLDLPGQVGARGLPENVQNTFGAIGRSVLGD